MAVFILAVARILDLAITVYIYVVIARALISWVNPDPYNPIVRFLHSVTDPVLYRLRRMLPFLQAEMASMPIKSISIVFEIMSLMNLSSDISLERERKLIIFLVDMIFLFYQLPFIRLYVRKKGVCFITSAYFRQV